jgi:hypothetical protein
LQICSLTRRGVSARQRQASARLARWLLSSKHTQQDCSAAHALRLGAVGSWQCALARSASPFITSSAAVCFTSPLVLHFTSPTLRQQRLRARTSCQERISSESTQPSTPAYSIIKAKHLRHPLSHPLIVSASAQTTVILVRQACLTHHSPSTTASILPCNDYCLLLRVRRCAAPLQISLTRHISTNLSLRHFTHTSVSLIAILGPRVSVPQPHSSTKTVHKPTDIPPVNTFTTRPPTHQDLCKLLQPEP